MMIPNHGNRAGRGEGYNPIKPGAYRMVSQGQLDWFPTLNAFYHFFNHPVRQSQADGRWHGRVGLGGSAVRASKRHARPGNDERRHLDVSKARRVRISRRIDRESNSSGAGGQSRQRVTLSAISAA